MNYSKILWVIALLILSPFLLYAVSQFVPGYDGYIVISGSMEPEIQTGSLLFTRKVPAEKIEVDETITFTTGTVTTTHRVIEKDVSGDDIVFRTKGVANENPDPGVVNEDQVQGKKMFSVPFLGYVAKEAATPVGFMLLIILPGTLLVLSELRNIFYELRNG